MQITSRFLHEVEDLLSPTGCFYLIALKQNNISSIRSAMSFHHHLHSEIVMQRRAGREHLFVLRFSAKATTPGVA